MKERNENILFVIGLLIGIGFVFLTVTTFANMMLIMTPPQQMVKNAQIIHNICIENGFDYSLYIPKAPYRSNMYCCYRGNESWKVFGKGINATDNSTYKMEQVPECPGVLT